MQGAICLLSVVPMRKEPSHRSEMVSQLLFGEYVTMGEERDDFVWVTCFSDGYRGWVQATQLKRMASSQMLSTEHYLGSFTGSVMVDGRSRMVPFGVPVYGSKKLNEPLLLDDSLVRYSLSEKEVWKSNETILTKETLDKAISVYLDTPYLWGGKSVFGIDCSGFAQQVFKLFGKKILRDAYLQAEEGESVASLDEARLGDLLFFQNEKGRITHVGILRENNEIVHASGKVRIDVMDRDGIINQENGKRTHHFHSISRFF